MQAAGLVMREELARYTNSDGQPLALDAKDEDRLVRLCHIASSFEAIYRFGGWLRGNSLGASRAGATLDELVDAVPSYVVDDIRRQMRLAAHPGPSTACDNCPQHSGSVGPSSTAVWTWTEPMPTSSWTDS
ncbi:hypothetical protein [Streptomyces luteogriseus]|uniref:hypothetical protein n=1 Tax=Streptomyces luteogriseus TaxID=68233 RepID=UPI003816D7A6